ncbi:MAG: beta-L-arabinofuranosidase domain-containing protein [Anaerocolumna sp.]
MSQTSKSTPALMKSFSLSKVKIMDSYSENSFSKELEYLYALKPEKLLAGFSEVAGRTPLDSKYTGWESTEIKGHTLGHYMTALSQAYENTKSVESLERIQLILKELKLCQGENGYLFATEEEIFDRVENRKPAWVPWYTMHKVLAGLVSIYHATKLELAKEIGSNLGDWVYNRTSKWSEELKYIVLAVEYGGMNDCLYDLYHITKKEEHARAAHAFDEMPLIHYFANDKDVLDGKHANTTIPKVLGALNRYITIGDDEVYLKAAINFFDMVVNHHTYVTGGNSEWEHFGTPDILDAERTNCNCETCNSYNMLKLAKGLFLVTGDKKYADFYEQAHINSILSSQNPQTGMTTYFQPMATGYFKVFGTPFDKFWCCTGTGMENFTKLNDGIYFSLEDKLFVNRYISSSVTWEEEGVILEQTSDIPKVDKVLFWLKISEESKHFAINLRIPEWLAGKATIKINGVPFEYPIENGYAVLEKDWRNLDQIELILPMEVSYTILPDNHEVIAFCYGPVVLSAALGSEAMGMIETGVAVNIPLKEMQIKDFIIVEDVPVKDWIENLSKYLVRTGEELEFKLVGTDEDTNLLFTPHYKQFTQRYGIYWEIVNRDSKGYIKRMELEEKRRQFENAIIDKIPLGNDQYELVHGIKGELTDASDVFARRCRIIRSGGWVSYEVKVKQDETLYLGTTYSSRDTNKSVEIYIDDTLLVKDFIKSENEELYYIKEYEINPNCYAGKELLTVKFKTIAQEEIRIYDLLYVRKAY